MGVNCRFSRSRTVSLGEGTLAMDSGNGNLLRASVFMICEAGLNSAPCERSANVLHIECIGAFFRWSTACKSAINLVQLA